MELFEKLQAKYPEAFKNCFDFSPPDGWEPIVEKLIDDLLFVDPKIKIDQVKEKFGELRVYVERGSDDTWEAICDLIHEAEENCENACQRCGKPGQFRNRNGWYYVACEEHV